MPTSLVTPSPKRMLLAATWCDARRGREGKGCERGASGERQHLTRPRRATRAGRHRRPLPSRDTASDTQPAIRARVRRTSNAYSFSTTLLPIRRRPVRSDCWAWAGEADVQAWQGQRDAWAVWCIRLVIWTGLASSARERRRGTVRRMAAYAVCRSAG